ncbi:hypothetical protein AGDE_12015 [Angomonas deanei]|uniref:Rubisco LSMT substrate-binding domain-containing protein n=1 Tax=Angomonas deanei TaxID=59799 RepID=A0A7G2CEV7_9TRYP|nr:hypothetical protein AGDE_12015 [Angomonas deanei]CAD2218296.1 hypothetical protein, conserved [Angomonas deanei]|eukprot:EPY25110.1 hypothetical protein AGDE_12015 [Angomonas deanei]
MQLDLEDVAYFKNILSKSDRADMKLFYLKRSLGDTFREEDPFGLGVKVDTQTAVDMRTLLQCARVVAADERTMWEYVGDDFFPAFMKVGDSWNEQLAAKVVHAFLNDRHEQDKEMSFALDAHMVAHIKPTSATAALFSGGRVQDIPAEGSVGVVPMVDGDAYSEGSIVCTAPLKAFGTLLRVPRSNMFFRDTVLQYSALGRCMASTLPLFQSIVENEEALLVLVLLYEKHVEGERSHWAPLLASCPPAYPTVPAYWSLTDLAEIEGVDVVDEVLSRKSLLQEFHAQMTSLAPLLFDSMVTQGESPSMDKEEFAALFTEDRLQWARTTFDSRAFNLNVDGRVVLSLVPYADMINHQNRTDALVRRVEPNGGDFVLQVGASVDCRGGGEGAMDELRPPAELGVAAVLRICAGG